MSFVSLPHDALFSPGEPVRVAVVSGDRWWSPYTVVASEPGWRLDLRSATGATLSVVPDTLDPHGRVWTDGTWYYWLARG